MIDEHNNDRSATRITTVKVAGGSDTFEDDEVAQIA